MFWTFNLSFDILATVLAQFPNIGQFLLNFLVTLIRDKMCHLKNFHSDEINLNCFIVL